MMHLNQYTPAQKALSVATFLGLMVCHTQSYAYEPGDLITRAGIASVQPDDHAFGTLGDLNANVSNDEALGLTFSYLISEHIGVGLLASSPFKHDITVDGEKIADSELLPPTLHLEYYPLAKDAKWQPFVGLGVNYTTFFKEDSALGSLALDDSVGLSFEAGIDYKINDKLIINATVFNIDIETDAKLDGLSIGGVDIDPWVYMLSVGYVFSW